MMGFNFKTNHLEVVSMLINLKVFFLGNLQQPYLFMICQFAPLTFPIYFIHCP